MNVYLSVVAKDVNLYGGVWTLLDDKVNYNYFNNFLVCLFICLFYFRKQTQCGHLMNERGIELDGIVIFVFISIFVLYFI